MGEMKSYCVGLLMGVSTVVDVETDQDPADLTYDDWWALAEASDDMPGGITVGAFGQASVDEDTEWTIHQVTAPGDGAVFAEPLDAEIARQEAAELRAELAKLRAAVRSFAKRPDDPERLAELARVAK